MRIYYDWEFVDTGVEIFPISIGMIREDGATYYGVNNFEADIPWAPIIHDFLGIYNDNPSFILTENTPWLIDNVIKKLPVKDIEEIHLGANKEIDPGWSFKWNKKHPEYKDVKPIETIRDEVREFIGENPELWAYYSAYDHVAFAQLWGAMSDLPQGIPYLTLDLQQEIIRIKKFVDSSVNFKIPNILESVKHHALIDAKLLKRQHEWLRETYITHLVL